jgi:hypothetical protein
MLLLEQQLPLHDLASASESLAGIYWISLRKWFYEPQNLHEFDWLNNEVQLLA